MRALPDVTPDTPTLPALRDALAQLDADTAPRWGRMDAAQMARHCRVFCELCLGRVPVSWPVRALARVLGPLFLRKLLRAPATESPKNLTTLPPLRTADATLDLDEERAQLLAALAEIEAIEGPHRHPLYGRMRAVDVRNVVRHHTSHHALQFGLL